MKRKTKWYNNQHLAGYLLICCPPIGLYGLYKSETIAAKWEKTVYGAFSLVITLLSITYAIQTSLFYVLISERKILWWKSGNEKKDFGASALRHDFQKNIFWLRKVRK